MLAIYDDYRTFFETKSFGISYAFGVIYSEYMVEIAPQYGYAYNYVWTAYIDEGTALPMVIVDNYGNVISSTGEVEFNIKTGEVFE